MEQFVSAPLPRDDRLALVDDWNCLRVSPCRLACSPLLKYEAQDLSMDACMLKDGMQ